ncbi:MAG: sigma 54-interacting transcriptional regulator [Pyrinomonadaceae bacterium]
MRRHTGPLKPLPDAETPLASAIARDEDVVSLDTARARLHPASNNAGSSPPPPSIAHELDATRRLLDHGLAKEAEGRLRQLVKAARRDAEVLAEARCTLSSALEMQGRFRESLEAVEMYELDETRIGLASNVETLLRVQLARAYVNTGDHPKAIALLNATLREVPEQEADEQLGAVYIALGHVYRKINEYAIARDYTQKALEHFRRTGDWHGLSEAYFGSAVALMYEGKYQDSLDNFDQALKLVGDHPAPFLLGKIYANMAGACWFLKRPHDGIRYLEKAISYYERTEHKANAALGYNNLAINLILVGDWNRAHEVVKRALELAFETDDRSGYVPMIIDSLGELQMLRGNLTEAEKELRHALDLATKNGNKWPMLLTLRTLGRCHLAMKNAALALVEGRDVMALAERIGDRQAICEARLLIAESHLHLGDLPECAAQLRTLTEEITDSVADLALTGETQRLYGELALAQGKPVIAATHFGRCASIFEMCVDRYRNALAHYGLGRAYTLAHPERAAEHFSRAAHTFRELGAQLALADAENALAALDRNAPEQLEEPSALTQLLTLRLAEAVASRELLLRELAAVVHQETNARQVLVAEPNQEDDKLNVVVAHGCTPEEMAHYAGELPFANSDEEREQYAIKHDADLIMLRSANAPPALLVISPRGCTELASGVTIEPLLRVVKLGMDVCALRAGVHRSAQEPNALAGTSLMPGFIHSSPAMTRLVEEVHKIRSSDVTVLVTGESGTGKELVSRAIHALSSRRSKVFIPFNCTAVPKELTEGYLFGYRRGAFTGAVADSLGVIRAASGGTLFLDEIGDLPFDVQPKLLRFLQEGEIQPLGEQRPMKVDVRIIAATNSNLEKMVVDGRFREDLYYRLNVIRLNVPPLCERRSEIPTIVNYYINHYSAKFNRRDISITPQALDLLMVCDWPGNVRQLCNEIQRVVARAEDSTVITPDQLSPELRRTSAPVASSSASSGSPGMGASVTTITPPEGTTLADALAELERRMIMDALHRHNGNISRAARELGLTRRGLYLKLDRHDLSISA